MLACTHSSCRFRKVLVALGARGRRSAERARQLPTPRPPSRRPALPEPESGRAGPLPAGGGRAAESRREGLWAQLAVPAVSSATTPGACACVLGAVLQCHGNGLRTPPPPAACLPPARRSLPPRDPPTSVRFLISSRVGLAWWEWVCLLGGAGSPRWESWGIGWDGEARRVCGWRLSSEAWGGTAGCGQARIQGPHVEHTVPSQLLAPHHWGAQTLV